MLKFRSTPFQQTDGGFDEVSQRIHLNTLGDAVKFEGFGKLTRVSNLLELTYTEVTDFNAFASYTILNITGRTLHSNAC